MSWFRTLIWGAVGFQLGGPLGAILGAATAKIIDDAAAAGGRQPIPPRREHPGGSTEQHRHQLVFFTTTFSLLGKLAKADGVVSREEIQVVEHFIKNGLQLDDPQRRAAIEIFNRAKDSDYSAQNFAEQFVSFFGKSPEMLKEMLRLLYRVAAADNVLHPGEKKILDDTAQLFGISSSEHERIRLSFFPSTDGYYARLGCTPADPMNVIKTRYKKLVLENHPDRMVAKGMPDEFVQLATEKLQGINEAYEAIKKERGE